MRKAILPLLILLLSTTSYCQTNIDSVVVTAERIIQKRNNEIKNLKQQVIKLRGKVSELLKRGESDIKLKNALQKLHFANKKIERYGKELEETKEDLSNIKSENAALKQKNVELTIKIKEIERFNKEGREYDSSVVTSLKSQKKEGLYEQAKQAANLDFYAGKSETAGTKETNNVEPLLTVAGGYKFLQGVIVHGIFGYTINKDKNIFLGLGTGYDNFRKDGKFGAMPLFLSAKISVDGGFVEEGSTNLDPLGYGILDVGFYPFLFGQNKENIPPAGAFANIGIGAAFPTIGTQNLSINPELTVRLNRITTVDFKIGLTVYLGR